MRIDALHLLAFGPFTDKVLSLHDGREGLHLIYGPNEAGKSSALRALTQLLYGIPERSADDFRHRYPEMRIGATLRSRGGETLTVIRRKGRQKTLRREDDATLVEDALLQRFLGGIDENLFGSMFGIDYEKLVRGGREILQGGGDLGRLIFAAGSGVLNLKALQDQLKADAEALFKPSGQKPRINAALAELRELRKTLKDQQLSGETWGMHRKTLARAKARQEAVEADLKARRQTLHRLARFQEALPVIARRQELAEALREYRDAPLLPDDFPEKRRELVSGLEMARHQRAEAEENARKLQAELDRLDVAADVLAEADRIEALRQEVGSQRKAARDRGELAARSSACRSDAREILRRLRHDLTLAEAEELRITREESVRIQTLAAEYERLMARREGAGEKLPLLAVEINQADADLAGLRPPRDTASLRLALEAAQEYGLLEKQSREEASDMEALGEMLAREQARLGIGASSPEAAGVLRIPAIETIQLYQERFDAIDRKVAEGEKALEDARRGLAETGKRLEIAGLIKDLPAPEDLAKARALRDRGWALVLAEWQTGAAPRPEVAAFLDSVPGVRTLDAAFAHHMHRADHIADRLRHEADRVAENVRLSTDRAAFAEQEAAQKEALERLERERADLEADWRALWPELPGGILTPGEMERWVYHFQAWLEKTRELARRQKRAGLVKQEIEAHREALLAGMAPFADTAEWAGSSLAHLVKRAQALIDEEAALSLKREQLVREKAHKETAFKAARTHLEESENRLEAWEKAWEAALGPLGLPGTARPAEANAVMEELQSLFTRLKELGQVEKQIERIDRDADAFARQVTGLTGRIAGDLRGRPSDEAAVALGRRLTQAQLAENTKLKLEKGFQEENARMVRAGEGLREAEAALQRMCEDAGCGDYRELAEAEKRSARRRQIETGLAAADDHLRRLSGGAGIEAFVREARSLDPDAIPGEMKLLETAVEELEQEKAGLSETIGVQKNRLEEMDGSAGAAALAETIQIRLGDLEDDVDRYARLKLETFILNKAIERYREKSQGPILKRASQLFQQVTGGSFDGIRADFDDAGQPVVVGLRNGGETVAVRGMSDGTADQLYLSLRLAGLEVYLETREPMPFVVDDVFIQFDDARAAAALEALAQTAAKTQVICFTHHRHLVALASKTLDASILFTHTL